MTSAAMYVTRNTTESKIYCVSLDFSSDKFNLDDWLYSD